MKILRCYCPELLHMDAELYRTLFGYLDYGDDLDDLLFYGETYYVSER